jgi:hypothetical protein
MNTISYSKRDLQQLETIEQAWDGDELKIWEQGVKVWLTHPENRKYNGDYTIEIQINGVWHQQNGYFE